MTEAEKAALLAKIQASMAAAGPGAFRVETAAIHVGDPAAVSITVGSFGTGDILGDATLGSTWPELPPVPEADLPALEKRLAVAREKALAALRARYDTLDITGMDGDTRARFFGDLRALYREHITPDLFAAPRVKHALTVNAYGRFYTNAPPGYAEFVTHSEFIPFGSYAIAGSESFAGNTWTAVPWSENAAAIHREAAPIIDGAVAWPSRIHEGINVPWARNMTAFSYLSQFGFAPFADIALPPVYPIIQEPGSDNATRNRVNLEIWQENIIARGDAMRAGKANPAVREYLPFDAPKKGSEYYAALVATLVPVIATGIALTPATSWIDMLTRPLTQPIRILGHLVGSPNIGTFAAEAGLEYAKSEAIKAASGDAGAFAAPIVGTAAGALTGDWTPGASEWVNAANVEARGALTTELVQAGVASPIAGAVAGQFSVTQLPNLANVPGDVTEAIKNLDLTVTLPDLEALQSIDLNAPDLPDLAIKLPDLDAGNLTVSMPDIHLPDVPATAPAGAPLTRAPADTPGATVVLSDKPAPWGLLLLAALAALSA